MPDTKFWAEMTWTDFAEADMARTIAVLPFAATEQHGPHLPLGTDTVIMEGYIDEVVAAAAARTPCFVSACAKLRAFDRAHGFSRHAQRLGRNPHQRLD